LYKQAACKCQKEFYINSDAVPDPNRRKGKARIEKRDINGGCGDKMEWAW